MLSHYAAMKARLEAEPTLAGKINDTALVTAAGLPFVGSYEVLYGGAPDSLDDERLAAMQSSTSDAVYVYTVRSVSPTAAGVRNQQAKVAAQLIGHRLVVAGRSCRVEQTDATDVDWDRSTNPPLYFADQEYTVYSSRV